MMSGPVPDDTEEVTRAWIVSPSTVSRLNLMPGCRRARRSPRSARLRRKAGEAGGGWLIESSLLAPSVSLGLFLKYYIVTTIIPDPASTDRSIPVYSAAEH